MQQHKQHKQAQHIVSARAAAAALSALAVLLAALVLAGTGGSVYAAPRSGGPTLDVSNIVGNTITIVGDGWVPGETITLSYSPNDLCNPLTTLPTTPNSFSLESSNFQVNITWPSNISGGTYYLCASGSATGGPVPTQRPIIINNNGTVQPTPGSTTPPNTTATGTPTVTGTPGHNPGSTATKGATTGNGAGGDSGPGNKGASTSTSVSSLVAIILLCLLVLALLIYLIRIWLQGRQASGPTP
jgi:hypothetical protein